MRTKIKFEKVYRSSKIPTTVIDIRLAISGSFRVLHFAQIRFKAALSSKSTAVVRWNDQTKTCDQDVIKRSDYEQPNTEVH
jgi:hypothetical protein